MSTHMSAAQRAQQNNRGPGGRYATKQHAEAGVELIPDGASIEDYEHPRDREDARRIGVAAALVRRNYPKAAGFWSQDYGDWIEYGLVDPKGVNLAHDDEDDDFAEAMTSISTVGHVHWDLSAERSFGSFYIPLDSTARLEAEAPRAEMVDVYHLEPAVMDAVTGDIESSMPAGLGMYHDADEYLLYRRVTFFTDSVIDATLVLDTWSDDQANLELCADGPELGRVVDADGSVLWDAGESTRVVFDPADTEPARRHAMRALTAWTAQRAADGSAEHLKAWRQLSGSATGSVRREGET